MHQITIEPALVEKLDAAIHQAVLCDTSGRAIGFFSPLPDRPKTRGSTNSSRHYRSRGPKSCAKFARASLSTKSSIVWGFNGLPGILVAFCRDPIRADR